MYQSTGKGWCATPVPGITLAGPSQALDTSLNSIISTFDILRDDTGVLRDCADQAQLKEHTGTAYQKVNYGRATANSVSDGAESAAQVLSDALTSATPGEVEAKVILAGSTIRRTADTSIEKNTAMILNNAYDLKEDTDGTIQFGSFTSSGLGGNTTVCSPGHGAAAAGQLRVGCSTTAPEPAPKPWYWVIHPNSAVPLSNRLIPYATTPAGATASGAAGGAHVGVTVAAGRSDGAITNNNITKGIEGIGMIAMMDVRLDANIAVNASSGAAGCAFARQGLIYVSEVEPTPYVDDVLSKALRGAKVYGIWGSYAWMNWRPAAYGILTTFDGSLATS